MSYQPQPPPGYHQPSYYPPPNYNYYYPPPIVERPANRGMKTTAIIFFVAGFGLDIFSLIPFIGFFFGILGLLFNLVGFICLCLI